MSRPVRTAVVALVAVLAAGLVTVLGPAPQADAAVVRGFTAGYDADVFGDFLEVGNGSMRCPDANDPVDPGGTAITTCPAAQARTNTATTAVNDSYYMNQADVDTDAATFNSSRASLTIPAGARVEFARLNWAGNTGVIKNSQGTIVNGVGCNTRQFQTGAGTATSPPGTPESTPVRLTVGSGTTSPIAASTLTRDPTTAYGASNPQYYAAFSTVTSAFANAPTGTALPITVGNVWSPEGFGCFAGWSLVLVYAFDAPNAAAPLKRSVFVYDGHVRQASTDAPLTTTVSGFRVADPNVRVGVTAYEGDFNITGDQFLINGTAQTEPRGTATNNFFVSDAAGATAPAVPNNFSVDAKTITTSTVPVGSTSANLTFNTSGDSYLAQSFVFSTPIPAIDITKDVQAGPYRPGDPITFTITVTKPGSVTATSVKVTDPTVAACNRDLGALTTDLPQTYTCTGPAPGADFTNLATVEAVFPSGTVTDSDGAAVDVINPAIAITKTADRAVYTAGDPITFTIVVRNTGDAPLSTVRVADPKVASCATSRPSLAVGESFTYTCQTTAPIAGEANTATATAVDATQRTVAAEATAPAPSAGVIAGRVFADRGDDGTFTPPQAINGPTTPGSGDTGIAGVTVTLTGTTNLGVAVNRTTTTGADGRYSFDGVAGGTYRVVETQPAAFDDGRDTPGPGGTRDGNDAIRVVLSAGASSTGNDFAELATSSLAGTSYEDRNGNGVLDPGEPGIAGVLVTLTGTDEAGNPVTLAGLTGADGTLVAPRLRAGTYTITAAQPDGYADGRERAGTLGGTVGNDVISNVVLPTRTAGTGYTFGEVREAGLSGRGGRAGAGGPGGGAPARPPLAGGLGAGGAPPRASPTRGRASPG